MEQQNRIKLEEMNKEQLRIEFDYSNSFALLSIGIGVSLMIALSTMNDSLLKGIFMAAAVMSLLGGWIFMKTRVRQTYLLLLEKNK